MRAVIMAGGLGTRMDSALTGVPKPMLPVDGKPVLLRQIECLARCGVTDTTIVTGFLGEAIESFFGGGKRFGAVISYVRESEPLGTAGALFRMKHDGDFLLINGDVVFDIDINRFISYHNKKRALATILTHPSDHPFDSALIETDAEGRVTAWFPKNRPHADRKNLANAGLHIISPELLKMADIRGRASLDRDILIPAVATGRVYSYRTAEYVRDMGTPERLERVTRDVRAGLPEKKRITNKQRAVFLDRDGTLNVYNGYICLPEQLELAKGAAQAVKIFNQLGYLAVVVTNQPVVARGMCGFPQLTAIHNRLETLLGAQGAYLDGIYFCPHHPDGGYDGETAELKIECSCRKPKPGMIFSAADDFNISLTDSYMVGDSATDIMCGRAAGCKTAFLKSGKKDIPPGGTPVFDNLLSFAESLGDGEKL